MTRKPPDIPDFELWTEVTREIRPLDRRLSQPATGPGHTGSGRSRPSRIISPPAQHSTKRLQTPPPLTSFDRRTGQKLQRGQADIDARIDLHGIGVETAKWRLLDFILHCYEANARLVLVITGKGVSPFSGHTLHGRSLFHAPEREGKLRRKVPEWLAEPEFRHLVIGFQPAHPKHGGGGALYVKLRRNHRGGRG